MEKTTRSLRYGNYTALPTEQHGRIIAEYIWIDGTGLNVRSKARTLSSKVESLEDIPEWNYDGSSCLQAITSDSEVILKPVNYFLDPFRGGDNILVLCSTYRRDRLTGEDTPANTNFRHFAEPIFKAVESHHPWFGIEQEYTLFEKMTAFSQQPLGWPEGGYPTSQGPYYCSVGSTFCFGRVVMDLHYRACLAANINISGTNAEVMPGQWEFQIGPCEGLDIGDHMWMARYLLSRVAEDLDIGVSFDPKPIKGDWNGAGCHTNFSTIEMREEGGYEHIQNAIEKLSKKHKQHVSLYGEGNERRLHGGHETCHIDTFKAGVGDRSASIRVPTTAKRDGKGYFEDRRPASSVDPYIVSALLCSTILLDGKGYDEIKNHYDRWIEQLKELSE
jgi:glutamine synthetase